MNVSSISTVLPLPPKGSGSLSFIAPRMRCAMNQAVRCEPIPGLLDVRSQLQLSVLHQGESLAFGEDAFLDKSVEESRSDGRAG